MVTFEPAIEAARTARELMTNIHSNMAAQQLGQAFMDMPEIPKFLRRKRGDPPDTTPMPDWVRNAAQPTNTFKKPAPIKDAPGTGKDDIDPTLEGVELAARMMKVGAREETRNKTREAAVAKEAKARAARNQRLGLPEDAPADAPVPAGYWDAANNAWRPEGYMSLQRYRRLLLGMPGPTYRAAFVAAYGHTQDERHRNPDAKTMRLLRHQMGIAEPAELPASKDTGPRPKAAAPAAAKAAAPAAKPTKAKAAPKEKSIAQSKSVGPAGNRVSTDREAQMLALLDRPQGCTLKELGAPFGWLEHSAGARLSALKQHHIIVKAKEARGTVYRRAQKEESK